MPAFFAEVKRQVVKIQSIQLQCQIYVSPMPINCVSNLFKSFYFVFNSLVITCHSILGIMGKIVVPRKKEGKNYSILLVNAFL